MKNCFRSFSGQVIWRGRSLSRGPNAWRVGKTMVVARHRQTSSRCHTVGRSRKLDLAQSSRRAVGDPLTSKSASWISSKIRLLHLRGICASLSVPIPARSRRLTGCAQRLRSPHGHTRKPFPVSASEPPPCPGGLRISASSTTRGFLSSLHLRTRALPLRETHHDHYQDYPPACRQ